MRHAIFADVDDTVIAGKSLLSFIDVLIQHVSEVEAARLREQRAGLLARMRRGEPRADVNRDFYREILGGRSTTSVARVSEAWAGPENQPRFSLNNETVALLRCAREEGRSVVLVTGSFRPLLDPVARAVSAVDILCADLEVVDGAYTGELLRPPVIEEGKVGEVLAYAQRAQLSLDNCWGVGDDVSDIPFLSLLGRVFVPGDAAPDMLDHARQQGWTILQSSPQRQDSCRR